MGIANPISLGDILLVADVREPINRKSVGPHYVMVLSPQDSIDAGDDLEVVVITTSLSYPLPSGWFEMPAEPGGHPTTGLFEACVVKATWQDSIPQADVLRRIGRSLKRDYKLVKNWLAEKERQMFRSRPNPQ